MKKSVGMLVACTAMLSYTGFAQNVSTNAVQEVLDFMNSPQGTGVVHKAQILMSASFGKIGISNELVRVSTDSAIALPIRQLAAEALQTYDSSATNSYGEIVAFLSAWPFRDETPPAMTTNTITFMKRGLEIGSSGFVHLESFLSDTNLPAWYREKTGQLVSNVIHQATH